MKRFMIFASVGGLATLIQFALLALMVEFKLLPAVAASAVSYALSAIFNYFANYHLTFTSNISHKETFPKFAVTAMLGLCVSTLLFAFFLFLINQYLIAQCLATGITLVLNFSVHKWWIYRKH
jgi:putative flippase GtrA